MEKDYKKLYRDARQSIKTLQYRLTRLPSPGTVHAYRTIIKDLRKSLKIAEKEIARLTPLAIGGTVTHFYYKEQCEVLGVENAVLRNKVRELSERLKMIEDDLPRH